MHCSRMGNGMPLAWGRTRLLETDWRLITQESHCFSCGSVNWSMNINNGEIDISSADKVILGFSL
jgi:predicted phosphohydrolase